MSAENHGGPVMTCAVCGKPVLREEAFLLSTGIAGASFVVCSNGLRSCAEHLLCAAKLLGEVTIRE